jgi:hypothetical protein
MALTIYNQDKSFYQIDSSDVNVNAVTKDVKSITINEEQMKLTTGTIVLRDDNQSYSKIFKPGAIVNIGWGFKDPLKSALALLPNPNNPGEYKGPIFRQGFKAFILTPGGSGNNDGTGDFTINFRSGILSTNKRKTRSVPIYGTPMTKGLAILQVLSESGYLAPFVLFTKGPHRMTDDISKEPLRQENETNFQFLRRMADEWNITFQTGSTFAGIEQAIFCDPEFVETSPFNLLQTGGVGLSNLFEYKGGIRNVLSYTWENNFIQDGQGDHVQFALVGPGFVVQNKQTVKTETVLAFTLNMKKLTEEFKSLKKKKGIAAANEFYQEMISATNFRDENIIKFWTPSEFKTAPQGGGIKVNIESFGSTLYSPGNRATLGQGFPEFLTEVAHLKIRKLTHQLDTNGYRCKIEITDRLWK